MIFTVHSKAESDRIDASSVFVVRQKVDGLLSPPAGALSHPPLRRVAPQSLTVMTRDKLPNTVNQAVNARLLPNRVSFVRRANERPALATAELFSRKLRCDAKSPAL